MPDGERVHYSEEVTVIDDTTTEPAWGILKDEPCRWCGEVGCVQFLADDHPLNNIGPQVVQCVACGRVWDTDGRVLN